MDGPVGTIPLDASETPCRIILHRTGGSGNTPYGAIVVNGMLSGNGATFPQRGMKNA